MAGAECGADDAPCRAAVCEELMNKRKFVRFSRRLFVRFGSPQPRYIGYTEDISKEGLFIKSNVVFKSGTPLMIEMKLSESNVVSMRGTVKWVKAVSPSLFRHARKAGIAVSLEHPPESYLAFINSLAINASPASEKTSSASAGGKASDTPAEDSEEDCDEQAIVQAYDALSGQDHYQLLRVERTATQVEIKRAYYTVAKLFHPDRHHRITDPAGLEQVKTLFCRVNAAYRVLSSDVHRRGYDFELSVRNLGLTRKEQAGRSGVEREVQLGQKALKERQISTAVYYFERAVTLIPDKSGYHDLLAQALSHLPQRKRDAERHYKKAIELEPSRTDYYCHLGDFYNREGFPARALEQFEAARVWDPDNTAILSAVRRLKGK
jgi:curved DNA-binding protein CbpA/Tfp pilus assembly protein PilZ